MPFRAGTTYLVQSDGDPSALLGLEVRAEDGRVMWFDTVRDRSVRFSSIEEDGDAVVVHSAKGVYRFSPLTVELYDAHVRRRVEGRPAFFEDEDLQDYYRQLPR